MFLDMAVPKTPSGSDFQELYSSSFHRHNTVAMVQRSHRQSNIMWQRNRSISSYMSLYHEELFPQIPQKTSPLSHWPLLCNMPFPKPTTGRRTELQWMRVGASPDSQGKGVRGWTNQILATRRREVAVGWAAHSAPLYGYKSEQIRQAPKAAYVSMCWK